MDAVDRCNRFEARSCGLLVAALDSTSVFCFVESMSSMDLLRPTRMVLLVLVPLFRMWLAFIGLRGDGELFLLLRAFFRLLVELEWVVVVLVVEVVEEEEERLMDEDEDTRLTVGILRRSISF